MQFLIFVSIVMLLLHDLIPMVESKLWNLSHLILSEVQYLSLHKWLFSIGHSHFIFSFEWKCSSPIFRILFCLKSLLFIQKSSFLIVWTKWKKTCYSSKVPLCSFGRKFQSWNKSLNLFSSEQKNCKVDYSKTDPMFRWNQKFYRFDEAGSIAEVDKHWIKFQLRESTRDSPKGSSEMLHEFVITTGKAKKWQTHQKYGILRGPDF